MVKADDGAVYDRSIISLAPGSGQLRRNYLSLMEVIAQAVGVIAPSVMPALALPSEFGAAGYGSWLGYAIATVALVFVSLNINEFAKREVSPGSLYIVAAKGLGPIWGVISGWSLLIGYVFTCAAVISGAANYLIILFHLPTFAHGGLAIAILLAIGVTVLAWFLAFRDIKLSTRTTLGIECATVLLILALVGTAISSRGAIVDVHQTQLLGTSSNGIRLGLVLAFFSFVGFEAATVVGTETKRPFNTIPKAVLLSVVLSGLFFIVVAYATVSAFHGLTPTLDKSEAPLNQIAGIIGMGWVGNLISAGVAMSCFACTLACINAGGRVLLALSRHGLVHHSTGIVHSKNATPHAALTVVAIFALACSLILCLAKVDLLDAFGDFGTLASFGFLVVYMLVSVGTPFYLKRIGALRVHHVIISIIAVALILVAIEGSLYPMPDWPLNILPYVFLAFVAVGVLYFLWLRRWSPQRLMAIEADLLSQD
jgi:amino acid transporter